jgi:hypothetical protein
MKPEDLAKARDGARLASALPYLEKELDGLDAVTLNKAFMALNKGELTGGLAVQLWVELAATDRLRKRLATIVKVGLTAGTLVPGL